MGESISKELMKELKQIIGKYPTFFEDLVGISLVPSEGGTDILPGGIFLHSSFSEISSTNIESTVLTPGSTPENVN